MLTFLFDDGIIFAVVKPAGIHSVALSGSKGESIAALLIEAKPSLRAVAPKELDGGLINRLDFDTSGILLGAHTKEGWRSFSAILKAGKIEKRYLVALEGKLAASSVVEGWIGSPNRGAKKVRIYRSRPKPSDRALPARSVVTPIRYDAARKITLAEVSCETARRHQVRAHCAALGTPLIGDSLYGAKRTLGSVFPELAGRGFFLHAATARFNHPVTGKRISLEARSEISPKG